MSLDIREENEGGQAIVRFSGEFEGLASQEAKPKLLAAVERAKPGTVALDFTAVEYVDSAGIGVLLEAAKAGDKRRVKLAVIGARDEVKRVFVITRVDKIIAVL